MIICMRKVRKKDDTPVEVRIGMYACMYVCMCVNVCDTHSRDGTSLILYGMGGGMVWYGRWYGMVWYGMIWYGMIWYGMIQYVWYGMVGMIWNGMVGMIWYGWYDMVWYGMT